MKRSFSMLAGLMVPALSLAMGLAAAPAAQAITINAGDIAGGSANATIAIGNVSAIGGILSHKVVQGVDGVGVSGGYVGGEIDNARESMVFSFDAPLVLSELQLGFLFETPNHDDSMNEAAEVIGLFGDSVYIGQLTVVDALTGAWSFAFGGAVTNLSIATEAGAGVFAIANPFGDMLIDTLILNPVDVTGQTDHRNADYSFVSMTAVPEPGTAMLLAAGLSGLLFAGRKRA